MAVRIFIPSLLRPLCGGDPVVDVAEGTFEAVLRSVDARCPGLFARLVEQGRLRPDLAIAVNGEVIQLGLHERIEDGVEIAIVPAMGGG